MKRVNYLYTIILIMFDRIIKNLVILNNNNLYIIPNIFTIVLAKNCGIAFGYMSEYNHIVAMLSIIIIITIIFLNKKIEGNNRWKNICIICILSGGIGNLIDRLKYGFVIDYISILFLPIFNLADVYIVLGILLLISEYCIRSVMNK